MTTAGERLDGRTGDLEAVQKRTLRVLAGSVVPAGLGMTGGYAAASVLAKELTDSATLAGVAAAFLSVGGAFAAVPLSRYMNTAGRRAGMVVGWSVAMAGAFAAFLAAVLSSYALLVVGVAGIGVGNATNLAARYAAADLASDETRGRAIGLLVWTSTFGSVLGPFLALGPVAWLAVQIGLPELAGPYLLSLSVFGAAAFGIHRLLRPDPLLLAQERSGIEPGGDRQPVSASLAMILQRPLARLAVMAMAVGQAVMVGVMTMTPVHMENGDQSRTIIGLVISLHIVGMYAFSPFVGWLVDRLGTYLVIAGGGAALFVGAELASHTGETERFGVFAGLFLIGVGWSCGLVAGSSLLTSSFSVEERVGVQGAADLLMVGSGAAAGMIAGVVVDGVGYHSLSHWAGIGSLSLVLAAALAAWQARKQPPLAAA